MDGYTNPVKLLAAVLSLILAQGPIITGHRSTRAHGTAGPNLGATISAGYTNSSSILSCSSTYATVGGPQSSLGGRFYVTNFGFAIPSGATIAGVTAKIWHWDETGNGGMVDNIVQLVKGGTVTGSNLASVSMWAAGSPEQFTYGGTGNLWGGTFTPADINAYNFGLTFLAKNTDGVDGTATIGIRCVQLTVTY